MYQRIDPFDPESGSEREREEQLRRLLAVGREHLNEDAIASMFELLPGVFEELDRLRDRERLLLQLRALINGHFRPPETDAERLLREAESQSDGGVLGPAAAGDSIEPWGSE